MIELVLAQIASRWGQAVTLFVLSLAAGVAAVSGAAYALSLEHAVIAQAAASARPHELTIGIPVFQRDWLLDPGADGAAERAAARDGFDGAVPVTTVGLLAQEGTPEALTGLPFRVISRDGICSRVTFVAGRCPVGIREAALPRRLADDEGLTVGQELTLTPVVPGPSGTYMPDAFQAFTVSFVGIFEAQDETDPYWYPMDPVGVHGQDPAIVVPTAALWTIEHRAEVLSIDGVIPAESLTPERLPELRREWDEVNDRLRSAGYPDVSPTYALPSLLNRIAEQTEQGRASLPIVVTPLVILCWFVVYLAVSNGLASRRREVGMVTLRGVKPWTRVLMVAGECALPVLAGAPLGLVVAPALVAVVGPAPGMVPVTADQLVAAAVATVGALAAVLFAIRRELSAPITELLRRVPRRRRVAVMTAEAVVFVLAVLAVVDLWLLGGELVGVTVVTPALVMLATTLVVVRVVRVLVNVLGRSSLRAGRLGSALAAVYLARRPGVTPMLVALGVALAMLGFAATTTVVAARARAAEAQWALGAPRVLEVQVPSRSALLQAVRAADPEGRYAMAVVAVPGGPNDPDTLAVDTTRLATVASWVDDGGGPGPAQVAEWLRPDAPEPVVVTDGELVAELSLDSIGREAEAVLRLRLSPVGAGDPVVADFGPVTVGRREYRAEVSGCPDGCRLTAVALRPLAGEAISHLTVVLHALRQDGAEVGPAGWLSDPGRWRFAEEGEPFMEPVVNPRGDGLSISRAEAVPLFDYDVLFLDAPYPLPVVTTGDTSAREIMLGLDRALIRSQRQGTVPRLPGVDRPGALVDLEYAERLAEAPGSADLPQVWLTADAPPEVVDRLREQDIDVVRELRTDGLQAELARSGPALAVRFFLIAAATAVLVGLVALILASTVDRRSWTPALGQLRIQGVTARTTTAATVWAYGGVVVAAALASVPALLVAWLATGRRLPIGIEPSLVPVWPEWTAPTVAGAAAVGALVVAAVCLAWWQRGVVGLGRR